MQFFKAGQSKKLFNVRWCRIGLPARAGALALIAIGLGVPRAQAQFDFVHETSGRARISGSVMVDGAAQPAARVRVDV